MSSPYTIYDTFNFEAICQYISEVTSTEYKIVYTKPHLSYLENYLLHNQIKTSTLLVEHEYIEKSFLEDYSEYFVRCFSDYGRKSTRIHFFSKQFTEIDFSNFLNDSLSPTSKQEFKDKLTSSYIGFLTVRPIPQTFIAKACIQPYQYILDSSPTEKNIIVKETPVNLFGIELKIKALPFQEQDYINAVCATSSMWVLLNAPIFQFNKVPSPSAITKLAYAVHKSAKLNFSTSGLNLDLMSSVLKDMELLPVAIGKEAKAYIGPQNYSPLSTQDTNTVKSLSRPKTIRNTKNILLQIKEMVYAYNSFKLPIILGLEAYDKTEDGYVYAGAHAVTVVGYSAKPDDVTHNSIGLKLKADGIDYLYVHDDQIGPYARADFDFNEVLLSKDEETFTTNSSIKIALQANDRVKLKERIYIPNLVLLGVYPKIRIPYQRIKATCISFNERLKDIYLGDKENFCQFIDMDSQGLTWDIKLSTVNDLKSQVLETPKASIVGNKAEILSRSLPKYLWVAEAYSKTSQKLFSFLFDATDIEQGPVFLTSIYYDETYKKFVDRAVKKLFATAFLAAVEDNFLYISSDELTEIGRSILETTPTYDQLLHESFGPPRPPASYKAEEVINNAPVQKLGVHTFTPLLSPVKLEDVLKTGTKYIWAICKEGFLHIGEDSIQQGHPTLGANLWARIAGELEYEEGDWVINGQSGRFMRNKSWHTQEHMMNAAKLIKKYSAMENLKVKILTSDKQPVISKVE